MKKHQVNRPAGRNRDGYVGFLDYRPHVELTQGDVGARTITVYISKAAASRAYADVRRVRLVFDAESPKKRFGSPEARRHA